MIIVVIIYFTFHFHFHHHRLFCFLCLFFLLHKHFFVTIIWDLDFMFCLASLVWFYSHFFRLFFLLLLSFVFPVGECEYTTVCNINNNNINNIFRKFYMHRDYSKYLCLEIFINRIYTLHVITVAATILKEISNMFFFFEGKTWTKQKWKIWIWQVFLQQCHSSETL